MAGPAHQSAGTAEIARDSGGDSMSVSDASSLEETSRTDPPALHPLTSICPKVCRRLRIATSKWISPRRLAVDIPMPMSTIAACPCRPVAVATAAATRVTRSPSKPRLLNFVPHPAQARTTTGRYAGAVPPSMKDGTMSIPDDPPSPTAKQP